MRIAVLPIEMIGQRARPANEQLDDTDMVLALDGRAYSEAVARALDGRLFASAFLLEAPVPAADGTQTSVDWAALADSQGADALLSLKLASAPTIMEASNSGYYLNFLFFLIGGPFCWWVSDHTYDVEAKLSAELYDLPRLKQGTTQLGSESSLLARISDASAPSASMDLNFVDRAAGDVGQYLISMVWPSPLLMRDNDDVRDSIESRTVEALAGRLAADMQADRDVIVQAPFLAPFYLEADTARVTTDDAGVHLRAEVLVLADSRVEEFEAVRVRWAGSLHSIQPREAEARMVAEQRYRVFALEWDHPDATGPSGVLTLRLEAETPRAFARTYTLPVAPQKTAKKD